MKTSFKITICATDNQHALIRNEYQKLTGSTNRYDHKDVYDSISDKYIVESTYVGTYDNMLAHVEKIRMAHPDQNVNVVWYNGKSFILNVRWSHQMIEFPGYATFTPEGKEAQLKALHKDYDVQSKRADFYPMTREEYIEYMLSEKEDVYEY